ncbi:MAG: hypothetical protein JWM34_4497 [Ilumatobacteraceae bacterium]|nr:hypothetical protein [Ilumatobacteraceae bacterium]
MPNPFLSDAWMTEAKAIRAKYEGQTGKVTQSVRVNQTITDVPFGDGTIHTFIDTSSGDLAMDIGSLETPDVTVTTDYATAKKLFVDQDQAAVMQAFMGGKIKVQGDMMKMMALQTAMPADDASKTMAEEIKAITAD